MGAVGSRAGGLVVQLRNLVNKRQFEGNMRGLSPAKVGERLLVTVVRWDGIPFSGMHFDPISEPVSLAADNVSSAVSASGATPARAGEQ
eukprot:6185716-Pleurochrysis_carterae.AAC.2